MHTSYPHAIFGQPFGWKDCLPQPSLEAACGLPQNGVRSWTPKQISDYPRPPFVDYSGSKAYACAQLMVGVYTICLLLEATLTERWLCTLDAATHQVVWTASNIYLTVTTFVSARETASSIERVMHAQGILRPYMGVSTTSAGAGSAST